MKRLFIIVGGFFSSCFLSQVYHDKITFSYGYDVIEIIENGKHIKYIKKPTVCTFNTGNNKSKVVCTNELFNKTYINIDDDLFDDSQKIKFPKKSTKFYDYKIVDDENYYLLKLCTDRAILLDIHGTGYVFYDYNKINKK